MTELQAIQGSIKHWKKNIKLIKNECLDNIEYEGDSCDCCKYDDDCGYNWCDNCPAFNYTDKKCTSSGWRDFANCFHKEDLKGCLNAANRLLLWLKEAETNCRKERQNANRKKD